MEYMGQGKRPYEEAETKKSFANNEEGTQLWFHVHVWGIRNEAYSRADAEYRNGAFCGFVFFNLANR